MSVEIAGVMFTKKVAERLFTSLDKLARFATDDNPSLDRHLTNLGGFITAINPFVLPLKTVLMKFQAETADETLQIMIELMDLLKNPLVKGSIDLLGDAIAGTLSLIEKTLNADEELLKLLEKTLKALRDMTKTLSDYAYDITRDVSDFTKEVTKKINEWTLELRDWVGGIFD